MTALSATYAAGTGAAPPRVLLSVTGAPSPTVVYTSNFAASDDSWTAAAGAAVINNVEDPIKCPPGAVILRVSGAAGTYTYSRTLATTAGHIYTATYTVKRNRPAFIALGVSGMTPSAFTSSVPGDTVALSYTFTATGTSHVLQILTKHAISSGLWPYDLFTLSKVSVVDMTTWQGTSITRTDANGFAVVREALGGQDTTAGTMTVTDYEAALTGTVEYVVVDGAGAVANATVAAPAAPGAWLTLPALADPAAPTPPPFVQLLSVTGWDENATSNGSVHVIIGRADPIANPGPLALRAGTLVLLCADYAAARAVPELLKDGAVALLRQPTFPGADLYLTAGDVALAPTTAAAPAQWWTAAIRYQEVATP